jgi:hypothetical protein
MRGFRIKAVIYVYLVLLVFLLPTLRVTAFSSTVSPPYNDFQTSGGNCNFPYFGQGQFFTCTAASTSTGAANEIANAYPSSCDLCNGAVYPTSYVYFDTSNNQDGAGFYISSAVTVYLQVTSRFHGLISSSYVLGSTYADAWLNEQVRLYRPDGSTIWYVWQVWDANSNGNAQIYSCDQGQPNVWCVYTINVGTGYYAGYGSYWYGGGYLVEAQAAYNQVYGSSAESEFYYSGSNHYITVGSLTFHS